MNYLKRNKVIFQKIFIAIILLIGATVRMAVYLQNRNLFIDEANVARNIYERNFAGLALPLSHEQYAPPVFMWIVKLCSLLFGFGEYSLRLYPLIAGIGALFLLVLVLKELTSLKSLWYPLFLMVVGYIFIRYSSELKQYMPDAFICLLLILLALKTPLQPQRLLKFTIIWVSAGSIAIWTCMPSVFVLAGVAAYYFVIVIKQKNGKLLIPVIIAAVCWVAQFAFYYFAILRPQANSSYLQNSPHSDYFLYLVPDGKAQAMHNWYIFRGILQESGGYGSIQWRFNFILLVTGLITLLWKQTARGLLLLVPILATLIAAALHQYSLITRLAIFMMPILLILIGCGFEYILRIRYLVWQLPLFYMAYVCISSFSMLRLIKQPLKNEEITESLFFMKRNNITGDRLYVHTGACPAYIYYTEINPNKKQWQQLIGAHQLKWDANYDSLAQNIVGRAGFIFTAIGRDELDHDIAALSKHLTKQKYIDVDSARIYAYIYQKS